MKKLMVLSVLLAGFAIAQAQEAKPKEKEEVKKTATIPQQVHNVIKPNDKEHSGYKVKKKTRKGKKYVKKVNTMDNTTTIKTKNAGELDKNVQKVDMK